MTPSSSPTCRDGCATRTGRSGALEADDATKQAVQKRLIALTDASKHDLAPASERLDLLLADLAAGRYGEAERG